MNKQALTGALLGLMLGSSFEQPERHYRCWSNDPVNKRPKTAAVLKKDAAKKLKKKQRRK